MQFVEFREIIKKRASIEDEWYTEIEKCWEEMTELFSKDINKTIQFLDICTADEFSWLSEIIEDIAKRLVSESEKDDFYLCDPFRNTQQQCAVRA